MNAMIYPKYALEAKWREDQKLYMDGEAEKAPICLRCGKPLDRHLDANALSRYIDVSVCSACGDNEGIRDYSGSALPLSDWYAVKHGVVTPETDEQTAVLLAACTFKEVFDEPRRPTKLNSFGYPESQLCYSRSDYNGRQWHTQWFDCQERTKDRALLREIDGFQNSLMALPEFQDLYTMSDLCYKCAEYTSDRTEFNLYSETEHFRVWVRMITREKDNNLYVNFYYKPIAMNP